MLKGSSQLRKILGGPNKRVIYNCDLAINSIRKPLNAAVKGQVVLRIGIRLEICVTLKVSVRVQK